MATERVHSSGETNPPQPGDVIPFPTKPADKPKSPERRRFLGFLVKGALVTGGGIVVDRTLGWGNLIKAGVEIISSRLNQISIEESTFTNGKETGVISPKNTFPVTTETANTVLGNMKRAGLADETTPFFALQLPEGWTGIIPYSFQEISTGFNPQERKYMMTDNENWLFLKDAPRGTKIVAPIDGIVFAFSSPKDRQLASGVRIIRNYNGLQYSMGIGSRSGEIAFKLTNGIPDFSDYMRNGAGRRTSRWDLIAELTEDTTIQISYTSTPLGSTTNLETPVPIKFLTATDNKPTEKLLVLKN